MVLLADLVLLWWFGGFSDLCFRFALRLSGLMWFGLAWRFGFWLVVSDLLVVFGWVVRCILVVGLGLILLCI